MSYFTTIPPRQRRWAALGVLLVAEAMNLLDATIMTVSGHYNAEAMPGGGGTIDIPEGAMVAAIVSSPQGPYYFRMVGAKKIVDANAPKLQTMLSAMTVR